MTAYVISILDRSTGYWEYRTIHAMDGDMAYAAAHALVYPAGWVITQIHERMTGDKVWRHPHRARLMNELMADSNGEVAA